jgi:ribosomal protein S17E
MHNSKLTLTSDTLNFTVSEVNEKLEGVDDTNLVKDWANNQIKDGIEKMKGYVTHRLKKIGEKDKEK